MHVAQHTGNTTFTFYHTFYYEVVCNVWFIAFSNESYMYLSLPFTFSLHSPHRQQLGAEYKKQVQGVLSQWEMDVEKSKELEEKLHKMLKEQQKLFQQQRIVQSQRLKTIKQLHEQYMKVKGT